MSESATPNDDNHGDADKPSGEGNTEQVRTAPLTARVPERVSRGVFTTGMIAMTGNTEFILDFLQCIGKPRQVAARVVMPHPSMPQFIQALQQNLEMYKNRFGAPHDPPRPPQPERRPTVQEIYDDLKLPEDTLSGCYANGVMISHTPTEFGFDFLTNFFPHSAVSCRVFLSAAQAPRILESLQGTYAQFQQRVRDQQQRGQQGGGGSDPQTPPPPETT